MLKQLEIQKLIHNYIGVHNGYLGDFSYRTHYEFYALHCDLEINVTDYEPGTTRDKFVRILETVSPLDQAKIIRGVLSKYPVEYFPEEERDSKQQLYDDFIKVIDRLERSAIQGIGGEVKNLIFAANGPKPEIVLIDATLNKIQVVKNGEFCLVYDRAISEQGLKWEELVDWWRDHEQLHMLSRLEQQKSLYSRLKQSVDANSCESALFTAYYKHCWKLFKERLPALLPQVYLHYDPYTWQQLGGNRRLPRQRMDFLLLLPYKRHIVIEIDGKQHYSENNLASPRLYADMVCEDRRLKLAGYEVYRFGGHELTDQQAGQEIVEDFFTRLFKFHSIIQ